MLARRRQRKSGSSQTIFGGHLEHILALRGHVEMGSARRFLIIQIPLIADTPVVCVETRQYVICGTVQFTEEFVGQLTVDGCQGFLRHAATTKALGHTRYIVWQALEVVMTDWHMPQGLPVGQIHATVAEFPCDRLLDLIVRSTCGSCLT